MSVGANNTNATFTGNGVGATFTKVGTAVHDLNGANQNYGTLAVSDGSLNVNGTLGTGISAVTATDTIGGAATKLRCGTVSQTLSSLTIGVGATVVFTSVAASGSCGGGGGKAEGPRCPSRAPSACCSSARSACCTAAVGAGQDSFPRLLGGGLGKRAGISPGGRPPFLVEGPMLLEKCVDGMEPG